MIDAQESYILYLEVFGFIAIDINIYLFILVRAKILIWNLRFAFNAFSIVPV